jgi:hypothetical protein
MTMEALEAGGPTQPPYVMTADFDFPNQRVRYVMESDGAPAAAAGDASSPGAAKGATGASRSVQIILADRRYHELSPSGSPGTSGADRHCILAATPAAEFAAMRNLFSRPAGTYAGVVSDPAGTGAQVHLWDSDRLAPEERKKLFPGGGGATDGMRDQLYATVAEPITPVMRVVTTKAARAVTRFTIFDRVAPTAEKFAIPQDVPCKKGKDSKHAAMPGDDGYDP